MIYYNQTHISLYDMIKMNTEGDGLEKTEQLTDSMFYIMAALTKPRHGYAIMNLIEETTKGVITIGPASMYTIIKKLLKQDRKSTRLNSSHVAISYAVFCLKKKTETKTINNK